MSERGVWVWDQRTEKLVPKHLYHRSPVPRSELPCPMVISDHLDSVWNPINGQRYDSKRAYEKAVRQGGGEIIGNESPRVGAPPSMPGAAADVAEAVNMIESRTSMRRTRKRRKA